MNIIRQRLLGNATYLLLLLVEVVDDDTDEQVEGEEGAEDDEDDKVEVHVQVDFILRLVFQLEQAQKNVKMLRALVLPLHPSVWPRDTYISRVHGCVHDVHPALKCCLRAEERCIRPNHVSPDSPHSQTLLLCCQLVILGQHKFGISLYLT